MKKIIVSLLCVCMLVSLAACAAKPAEATETEGSAEAVGMANPFVDYDTMEAAAEAVGFDFAVPDTIEGYPVRQIQVMSGELLQVLYLNDAGDRVILRKAAGDQDISGDYNSYDEGVAIDGEDWSAELRGTSKGFFVATWISDGYTYAITTDQPMTQDAMTTLAQAVK